MSQYTMESTQKADNIIIPNALYFSTHASILAKFILICTHFKSVIVCILCMHVCLSYLMVACSKLLVLYGNRSNSIDGRLSLGGWSGDTRPVKVEVDVKLWVQLVDNGAKLVA